MSSDVFTARELLQHAQADVTALLTILGRHRLSALEQAVVAAIAERHGSTPTSPSTSDHLVRSEHDKEQDWLAGMEPEARAACEAELRLMGRRR